VDNGVSGSTLERPGLRQLRALVRAQAVEGVICLDPDRLSRSLGHLFLLEEEAKKAGVALLYVNFKSDDTPEGRPMSVVKGAVAEYERAKILQRSWTGKTARASKGLTMVGGAIPYGYRYLPPNGQHQGLLEIEQGEAETVKRIFAWRLSGLGIMKIVRLLTAEGVPTRADLGGTISPKTRARGVWSPSVVHRMLRAPTYVGRMAWNKRKYIEPEEHKRRKPRNDKAPKTVSRLNPEGEWIKMACPAIIDQPTWDAVQALLDQGKTTSPRRRKYEYLFLGGRLRCGRCGNGMSGFFDGTTGRRK
jgi:site-specific DNA recombinase